MRRLAAVLFTLCLVLVSSPTFATSAVGPDVAGSAAVPAVDGDSPAPGLGSDLDADLDGEPLFGVGPEDAQPAACQQVTTWCDCSMRYSQVCGCDGVTYTNACHAACEVTSWSIGECSGGWPPF